MGSGTSRNKEPDETATRRNKDIDKELHDDKKTEALTVKLLLLGGAESGKSTIAKQMKIIHLNGFDECEMINFRFLIFSNIVEGVRKLIKGVKDLQIEMDQKTTEHVELFYTAANKGEIDRETIAIAKSVWECGAVQKCFNRKDEIQLGDNVQHFMINLDRIRSPDFTPSESDILFCRVATTGVNEIKFPYKNKSFRLIDVGGQKSERRKWIHCFEDVTAIMFVAALSGYDQVLEEDTSVNRMTDAITLFNDVYSNEYFKKSSAILFLNKKDVFERKIERVPLKVGFPQYTGPNNYPDASQYIRDRFIEEKNAPEAIKNGRQVYSHFTNATDTENVEIVFTAAADVILKKSLGAVGVF